MRLILKERVRSLGNVGDIVNVSAGYARNYLIPHELAVTADETNKRFVEDQQRRLAKKIKDQKQHAVDLRKVINGVTLELTKRVGGNGKLFGAVTVSELVQELKKLDIEIEKRWIHLDAPLKELGTFSIRVKIFADVEGSLKVKVLMDPVQMEEMRKSAEEGKKARKAKVEDEQEEGMMAEEQNAEGLQDDSFADEEEVVEEKVEKKSRAKKSKKAE